MKKMMMLLSLFLCLSTYAETGILFIAHGTMNHTVGHGESLAACTSHHPSPWENFVLTTLNGMKGEIPKKFEVAFGMWESHCYDQAIDRLTARLVREGKKLDHLVVFPLFISSHSEVIEMQKYIFKKRPDIVLPIPHVHPTKFKGPITYMNALDYDPHVSMILAKRFHHLIHLAKDGGLTTKQMEIVLIMHGPVGDQANLEWMKMGERYNKDLIYLFPVSKSHVISLRDDAPTEVRDLMTAKLRTIVREARREGRIALLLPLLIAKGGIDQGILQRLNGLEYIWSGDALFPDTKLQDVIVGRLNSVLSKKE